MIINTKQFWAPPGTLQTNKAPLPHSDILIGEPQNEVPGVWPASRHMREIQLFNLWIVDPKILAFVADVPANHAKSD